MTQLDLTEMLKVEIDARFPGVAQIGKATNHILKMDNGNGCDGLLWITIRDDHIACHSSTLSDALGFYKYRIFYLNSPTAITDFLGAVEEYMNRGPKREISL
jgi:hypothetical protein